MWTWIFCLIFVTYFEAPIGGAWPQMGGFAPPMPHPLPHLHFVALCHGGKEPRVAHAAASVSEHTVSEHCVRTLHVRKSLCQNTVCQNTVSEHCKKVTETELKPLQRHFKSYVRVLILKKKNAFNSQLFI